MTIDVDTKEKFVEIFLNDSSITIIKIHLRISHDDVNHDFFDKLIRIFSLPDTLHCHCYSKRSLRDGESLSAGHITVACRAHFLSLPCVKFIIAL